ncbi:MAG: hypothetical protein DME22_00915 [Verrucomicrobia bacterium]|nr:MAG: hypothetical protein DME22_00915 [Verrucomicrobiota bacterium]PYJ98879.1 MAG: hypothetical protein DME23_10880 [Verrucomicrobiota bacterium]
MNNIVLAATLLVSSGFVFIAQRSALHNLRRESGRLAGEIESSRLLTAEAAAGVASLKGKVEEHRSRRSVMRSSLSTEHATGETIPMAPEKEGVWPPDKPYFYLNKRRLADAIFRHITPDFHLAPEAAIALGMTPGEAAAVDEAFHSVVETFRALEVEHLMPSTEHASTRFSREGRKTSYRLPALKELMEPTVENFVASTRAILGDSRAEIFNHWARLIFTDTFRDFAPRIFTFTDDEVLEVVEEGGKLSHYFELRDLPRKYEEYGLPEDFRPRFPYRHLFGENGQNRPGVQPLSE